MKNWLLRFMRWVALLACPAVESWYPLRTAGQASSGTPAVSVFLVLPEFLRIQLLSRNRQGLLETQLLFDFDGGAWVGHGGGG